MLAKAKLQTIIWTSDIGKAEQFYSHILGLSFKGMSQGALIYSVDGGDLRVSPVPHTDPSAHTVLGFSVPEIHAVVRELNSRDVKLRGSLTLRTIRMGF